jgi:hypothetical protein
MPLYRTYSHDSAEADTLSNSLPTLREARFGLQAGAYAPQDGCDPGRSDAAEYLDRTGSCPKPSASTGLNVRTPA